jgi:PPM family protein phosphatase
MPEFDHACSTTQGARDYQEDTAQLWSGNSETSVAANGAGAPQAAADNGGGDGPPPLLAVLADGMGGHAGGAVASRTVCDTFIKTFAETDGSVRNRLVDALRQANTAVAETAASNPILGGMGSTLVGAVFTPEGVEWVSVGDSPLMLYRRGEIAFLNEDHSLAPELDRQAAEGKITTDEARSDPRRHMLRSAVTGDEIDLVDVSRRPLKLQAGDYILVASDGLHTLEPGEIERIVTAYGDDGAEAVANGLIRAVEAMRVPHQDNTTVVAVRISESPSLSA